MIFIDNVHFAQKKFEKYNTIIYFCRVMRT